MNRQAAGKADARALIDAWWPQIEAGAEAVLMTASGCGTMVKEFGHLLRHEPAYAAKAARISALTRDLSEVLASERAGLEKILGGRDAVKRKIAFHSPCSLQHGQKIQGAVEPLLELAGFELTPVADAHLCCGSAGTYSILQPELARQLRVNKLAALHAGMPEEIATANIGCLTHLASGTQTRVLHWVQLLDRRLAR